MWSKKIVVPDCRDRQGLWVARLECPDGTCLTPASLLYRGILTRCAVGGSYQKLYPTYVGCISTFDDFQHFAEWATQQAGYSLPGFQLDKDLLAPGQKLYSPDTCVFVPQEINKLLHQRKVPGRTLPPGVRYNQGTYVAQWSVGNQRQYLSGFLTADEAYAAYRREKEAHVRHVAKQYRKAVDSRVFDALMSYQLPENPYEKF